MFACADAPRGRGGDGAPHRAQGCREAAARPHGGRPHGGAPEARAHRRRRTTQAEAGPRGEHPLAAGMSLRGGGRLAGPDAEQIERTVADRKGAAVVQAPLSDDELRGLASGADSEAADTDSEDASDVEGPAGVGERRRRWRPSVTAALPLVDAADEARAAAEPGYWRDRLAGAGALQPVTLANARANALAVNHVLVSVQSWRSILTAFRDLRHCADGISIATATHRLARLSAAAEASTEQIRATEGYGLLVKVLRKRFGEMRPRARANVIWALATIREDGAGGIFNHCLDVLERDGFCGQWATMELSNVAWALATMRRRRPGLLRRLAREVLARDAGRIRPQSVANLAWCFASLQDERPRGGEEEEREIARLRGRMFKALADGCWMRLHEFAPQAVSNTIWSYAQVGHSHQALNQAVNAEIRSRVHEFSNQEAVNSLTGLAKLSAIEPGMMTAFCNEMLAKREERFAGVKTQVLANILWSMATTRFYEQGMLDHLHATVLARMADLDYRELSNIMWGMAKLGYHPGERFLDEFNAYTLRNWRQYSAQATSNVLWALAVLQATYLPCFQLLIDHLGNISIEEVALIQLHQLFQALLLATIERRHSTRSKPLIVPKDVISLITKVWKELAHQAVVSAFQRDVSEALLRMGIAHKEEYMAEEGLFSIDIAFTGPSGARVAMEVDGPFHFTSNTFQPMGSTLLRHRLLRALGWTVVSIPFFEYYPLATPLQKYEYVARKLLDVGIRVDPRRIQEAMALRAREEAAGGTRDGADAADWERGSAAAGPGPSSSLLSASQPDGARLQPPRNPLAARRQAQPQEPAQESGSSGPGPGREAQAEPQLHARPQRQAGADLAGGRRGGAWPKHSFRRDAPGRGAWQRGGGGRPGVSELVSRTPVPYKGRPRQASPAREGGPAGQDPE